MPAERIVDYVCEGRCGARWDSLSNPGKKTCSCGSSARAVYSTRTKVAFGVVRVIGPHNGTSNKWEIDLVHSRLSLYWRGGPERAAEELAGLRAALDFIEEQVLGGGAR